MHERQSLAKGDQVITQAPMHGFRVESELPFPFVVDVPTKESIAEGNKLFRIGKSHCFSMFLQLFFHVLAGTALLASAIPVLDFTTTPTDSVSAHFSNVPQTKSLPTLNTGTFKTDGYAYLLNMTYSRNNNDVNLSIIDLDSDTKLVPAKTTVQEGTKGVNFKTSLPYLFVLDVPEKKDLKGRYYDLNWKYSFITGSRYPVPLAPHGLGFYCEWVKNGTSPYFD
ncbi:hypothetical protein B0J14DRAFT_557495 [Halenospora varia]|nr:hypothetical protein B0J14DRAFT_557495 [Halenospora varia]